jgi:hypothetical protein
MEFDVMDKFLNKVHDDRMRGLKIQRKKNEEGVRKGLLLDLESIK